MLKTCIYFLLIVVMGTMSILAACAEPTTTAPAEIKICLSAEPDTLDTTISQTQQATPLLDCNIFEQLVTKTHEGQPTPSGIATWKVLDGGKCFEFAITKGIKFTSGDTLTARDVEFTWNRLAEKNKNFMNNLRNFDRVEVVNDYTIRFYYTEPSVMFLYQTCPVYMKIVSKSYYDRVGEEKFVASPVGAGPYKLATADWKLGQDVDLVANEDYWGEKPQIKQARFTWAVESSTRIAMLQAGEVDLIMDTPWPQVDELEESGFKSLKVMVPNSISLQFDLMNPNVPWADLKVRQAINYAVDKDAIINKVFNGVPVPLQWLASTDLGYDPTLKPAYPYDPAKAKELLTEAGYPNGFEATLYFQSAGNPKDAADYVILALKDIGITCNPFPMSPGPQFFEIIRGLHSDPTQEGGIFVAGPGFAYSTEPVTTLQMLFFSGNPLVIYVNRDLDAVISEALVTMDDTKRGELIKQCYKIIDSDLPFIPICANRMVIMMKPNIDFEPTIRMPGTYLFLKDMTIK